MNKVTPKLD